MCPADANAIPMNEFPGGFLQGKTRGLKIAVKFAAQVVLVLCAFAACAFAQSPLGKLNVTPHDPLYTTYAAPLARSEYFVDEAYHLNYYTPTKAVTYETDTAGEISMVWRMGGKSAIATKDFYKAPVIHRSYTDIVEVEYRPFATVEVRETFVVYSSRFAVLDIEVVSHSKQTQKISAVLLYRNVEIVKEMEFSKKRLFTLRHTVLPGKVMETPQPKYEQEFLDLFLLSDSADTFGSLREDVSSAPDTLPTKLTLAPNARQHLRVIRGAQPISQAVALFLEQAKELVAKPIAPLIAASEAQYKNISRLKLPDKDWELAYWSAFNLVRQQMLPPEGEAKHNYYVFSREPTWSWGHEGQVFHESLSMLSYVFMDAASAQDSQRIFMERQSPTGYIAYRVGPYVTKTFPVGGEETSSAPFFAWTNWEIYQVSHDKSFLAEAYRSSAAYAEFMLRTRDKDGDGFLVWGGNAVLECVRDEFGVIWQLFGHTPESPKKVKSLDLSTMMVMEMRSLAQMAGALGKSDEARDWTARADKLAELIRTRMWDEKDGFFYNLARDSGAFTTKDGVSLKRKEIIGFLPMWAGVATKEQAARLVKHLTNPESFWRRYGVPTLAADDAYYNGNVTKCCQWNGAVWLLWDYMVFRGLLNYGYRKEAEELARRVMDGVIFQLKENHRFWESYSPDNTQLASPKNYLWDCIIVRMMIDLYGPGGDQGRTVSAPAKRAAPRPR